MKQAIMFIAIVFVVQCANSPLVKTEHGYRGKYLTITRMLLNGTVHNLSIHENMPRYLIDRGEVYDIISSSGGFVLDGDFAGLNIVMFRGMNSKQKQDSVILSILPKLERWYRKELNH